MKRMLGCWIVWMAAIMPGFAAGLIIVHEPGIWPPILPPHPPRPIPPPVVQTLPVEPRTLRADVSIEDQIARTKIDQEFYNPNTAAMEATFLLPVPKGAHLERFAMEINGKLADAELLKADKARALYEGIVRQMKDPGLLEYCDRDVFKVRIFPLEPRSTKRITIAYSQVLKADAGLVEYTLPLSGGGKHQPQAWKDASVVVNLKSKASLKSVYSPSHKVDIRRDGPHAAKASFESSTAADDFQLFYGIPKDEFGMNLLTWKEPGEDGYFLLLANPGMDADERKVSPKDVVFVLDTSGSMAGPKLEQAKKALQFCVASLNAKDRFDVLRFATEVEPLFGRLTDADSASLKKARNHIDQLNPLGGTAIDDALEKALSMRPAGEVRPFVVVFLTDGKPTVGVIDEKEIVQHATREARALTRIFCFGIGTDVNTHLLDEVAERTRAFSTYVLPEEDIEVKVSSFFTKIREPVLASPELQFPDGVRATKMHPSKVPDLFKGEQLVLTGRYQGSGSGTLSIQGTVDGEHRVSSQNVDFDGESRDGAFIKRLWATRRVGFLLDEIRLRGESAELKEEATELACKYGIVTPYTAYLILEDEKQRGVAANQQSLPALREDRQAQTMARESYESLSRDRSGAAAVSGAMSSAAIARAERPSEAIQQGSDYALRSHGYGGAAPAASTAPKAGSSVTRTQPASPAGSSQPASALESSGRMQFAGGRTFYLNGSTWIDSEVQKLPKAKRVQIQFDSPEYYNFAAKHPETARWLALGQNVQFVLNDTVYEITAASK